MQLKQEVAARQSQAQVIGSGIGAVGNIAGAAMSDRRAKKNIKLIGKSNSGLNIYAFEYINKTFGKGTMARCYVRRSSYPRFS